MTEVFATAELCSFEPARGPDEVRAEPVGRVRFGAIDAREVHPGLFPPAFRALADYGAWCYVRVVVPFELTPLDPGDAVEFADATVAILRPGPDAVVLDLEPPRRAEDGGLVRAPGAAALPVAFDPHDRGRALRTGIAVRTAGPGLNAMRWTLAQSRGGALPAGGLVVAGVVQLHPDATTFSGELAPQATAVRPLLRLRRPVPTWTRAKIPFSVPVTRLPAATPPAPEPSAADAYDGAQRLCLAAGLEAYDGRTTLGHRDARQRLVDALAAAAQTAGAGPDLWQNQPGCDGLLAILPPGLDPPRHLPDLLHGLRVALRETNRFVRAEARIRLRLGLQFGLVLAAADGFAGSAVIEACRLRDCGPVRALLRADPGTDLVVAASPRVHDEGLRAAGFERVGSGPATAWISATV
jgi:hypothetical protein